MPASKVLVVRELDVWNGANASVNYFFSIQGIAAFATLSIPSQYLSAQWQGRLVMVAGQNLVVQPTVSGSFNLVVSGYLLSA